MIPPPAGLRRFEDVWPPESEAVAAATLLTLLERRPAFGQPAGDGMIPTTCLGFAEGESGLASDVLLGSIVLSRPAANQQVVG